MREGTFSLTLWYAVLKSTEHFRGPNKRAENSFELCKNVSFELSKSVQFNPIIFSQYGIKKKEEQAEEEEDHMPEGSSLNRQKKTPAELEAEDDLDDFTREFLDSFV